tara:strand:+ start:2651 stop:3709 length:1059 start_codon:yes stop_codon:yes gene_type:complete
MAYTQKKNPFPVTSCGRRRTYMQDGGVKKIGNKSPLKKNKEKKEKNNDTVEKYIETNEHLDAQNQWLQSKRHKEMLEESVGSDIAARIITDRRKEKLENPNLTSTVESDRDDVYGHIETPSGGYDSTRPDNKVNLKVFKSDEHSDEHWKQTADHEASHVTDTRHGGDEKYNLGDVVGENTRKAIDIFGGTVLPGTRGLTKFGDKLVDNYVRGKLNDKYIIPKKDIELINNSVNDKSINDFKRDLKKEYPYTSDKQIDKYANEDYDNYLENKEYYTRGTEVRARLSEMRNILNRTHGVDIYNEKVTKDDLDKVINSKAYKGLNQFYEADKILNMMNKISKNTNTNTNDNTRYA